MNEYGDNQQNILLTSAAQTSLIKKCCMTGGTPWGFRIMTDLNSILKPGILSNLVVSKVRSRSKAYFGGLKEGDVLLFINDFPTYSLTLEAATDLIEAAKDLNLVVSTDTSQPKRPMGRSGSVCSAIGIGNRFNSAGLKNSTSTDQNLNSSPTNSASTSSTTNHQQLLFSRDLFNESKAYLQSLERSVNEKQRRGSSGSGGGVGGLVDHLNQPNNNSINAANTFNASSTSLSRDYLIKPVSLKTLRKLELDNSGKLVHNASARQATTPTPILDFNSLLLNSPTASTTSTTTTTNTLSAIPGPGKAPLSRMASNPSFTRFYNNPPSQQQLKQHAAPTTNYKLEAQQLVRKFCRGGGGGKLQCSATDHEDEDEKRSRSRRQYYSLLKNGSANSLRNYHKLSRKAYSSATESYGEEEEELEESISVNYPSEYETKLHNNNNNNNKNYQSSNNKLPNSSCHEITQKSKNFLSPCSSIAQQQEPRDNSNSSRISYATITLRQPKASPTTSSSSIRKELNYFSDTEAVHSGVHRVFRLKNSSSISLTHNTANNYLTLNNNTNTNQANAQNSSALNLLANASNPNISKAAINRTSSLAYRNLNNNNNNIIKNRLQQQLPTDRTPQKTTAAALNTTDFFLKKSDSLFISSPGNNKLNSNLDLQDQKQHQQHYHRGPEVRKSLSFNQTLEAQPSKMTSISQFMKSNMLPEFPAHENQQPIQYNNSYNNQAKGFVSQYNPSQQGHQPSNFTSMPIKWSPAVQQQQQQPQQHVQMQQYQQQQHDYQQDYQSDYQQEYTPKPDPQMVYQKSLAQSRQQQNEYLAEMQRNQEYNNYDEDEEYQQYAQMGSGIGFGPKKNAPKYADSYFYNSPDMKYPTINDQKKLARSIAATLEGSNTASKYHKKKETINRQLAADDDEFDSQPQRNGYYQPQTDHYAHQQQQYSYQQQGRAANSVMYDDSVPDVIKRSIAQANMSNPLNNVQAPEYFKEAHLQAEANSHTQCPPSEAINLAHALENSSFEQRGKGGKGTILFQKRKARMEKLATNEEERQTQLAQNTMFQQQQYQSQVNPNDNFRPQQHQTPIHFQHQRQPAEVKKQAPPQQQQQQQYSQHQQQQQQVEVEESHYRIPNVGTNGSYSKFSNNFNIKPRGWGSVAPPQMQTSSVQMSTSSYEQPNPSRLDLDQWNNPNRSHQQQYEFHEPAPVVSKVGVSNLKGMLYEQPQQSSVNVKPSVNIVSSHDNHLFNSRTSTQQITLNTAAKNTSQHSVGLGEPRVQQHTVQFQIAQPNQNRIEQSQHQHVKPQQQPVVSGGSIKYQIFDDDEIAASDL